MNEQRPSNQWRTPWRASGLAVYDATGQLVIHTGITGNRSMPGEQLELMAAMVADAVNRASDEPPAVQRDAARYRQLCQNIVEAKKRAGHVFGITEAEVNACIDDARRHSEPPRPNEDLAEVISNLENISNYEPDFAADCISQAILWLREWPSEPPPEGQFSIGESVRVGPFHNGEYSKVMKITGAEYYCDNEFGPYSPSVIVRATSTKSEPGWDANGSPVHETSTSPSCNCDRSSAWKCQNSCNNFICSCNCHGGVYTAPSEGESR